jgi:SHS2 domain-containing protein
VTEAERGNQQGPAPAGHRIVDHTADHIVRAWGPTRAACLEQAVLGFVSAFAAVADVPVARTTTRWFEAPDDPTVLLCLLEEVVFLLDADGVVPVSVEVADHGTQVAVTFGLVQAEEADPTGPTPKGISHSGLDLAVAGGLWQARILVDV